MNRTNQGDAMTDVERLARVLYEADGYTGQWPDVPSNLFEGFIELARRAIAMGVTLPPPAPSALDRAVEELLKVLPYYGEADARRDMSRFLLAFLDGLQAMPKDESTGLWRLKGANGHTSSILNEADFAALRALAGGGSK